MKIPIKIKQFGERGLHAYFSKKHFHVGQEILVEVDDLSAATRGEFGLDLEALKLQLKTELVNDIEKHLVDKYMLDKSKRMAELASGLD